MSQQAVIELVRLAETDETVLSELQAADTLEAKAAVAARHGCHVGIQELAALRALAKQDAGGELSEEELELVSGGSLFGAIRSAAKWVYKHVYVDVKNKVVGGKGTF